MSSESRSVIAEEITLPVEDGDIPGYHAMPSAGNDFPAILVVQEIFGLHEWIKDICRRLAKLGYYAIAPELYARQGDPATISDTAQLINQSVGKVPDAQVMGDLDAAVAYARSAGKADTSKLGITGFCWGGRIVWMYAAHNPDLKAAAAWYGPVARSYHEGDKTALDIAPNINAAVLGLYGGADPGIPVDTVQKIKDAMTRAGKTVEIVVYPDTPHAFFADYRPSYRNEAAEDGWKRMTAWFRKYILARLRQG